MKLRGKGMERQAARTRLAIVLAVACLTFVVGSADGEAHDHATIAGQRQLETQLLGAEHAAEHARIRRDQLRALRRWRRLSPERRHRIRRAERQEAIASAQLTALPGSAKDAGRWTQLPFRLPTYALHAAMLPTGKVLIWGYPPIGANGIRPNFGRAALWDPKLGTGPESMREVPPPLVDHDGNAATAPVPAPVYCSGQSFLPSGELLIVGGNLVEPPVPNDPYTGYAGRRQVFTFNPWSERWVTQPDMAAGRWYPTQTLLPDGRTVLTSGYTEAAPGGVLTNLVEEYTPAGLIGGQGSVRPLQGANRTVGLYPRMNLMPNGDVLMAGPGRFHVAALRSQTAGSGSWIGMGAMAPLSHNHGAGTAVLRSGEPDGSWKVTTIGGIPAGVDANGSAFGTTTVETLDYRNPSAGWSTGPSLQIDRAHHNTVLLPDGSMVTVGGGVGITKAAGNWAVDPAGVRRQVEIFNPETETWRLGAAQVEDRAYHSTALLLPDGRVFSAGDDHNPMTGGAISSFNTAEIYTPAPLYVGKRPRIQKHPRALAWGDEFTVRVYAGSEPPAGAVLMAPSAVTHGVDMSQRRVELVVTRPFDTNDLSIRLKAPPTAAVAPPGHYMLFLLSADGVWSAAGWTQISPTAPDAP